MVRKQRPSGNDSFQAWVGGEATMQQPETRLYRAVVLQAVADIAGPRLGSEGATGRWPLLSAERRLRQRAFEWVLDDADYPFSFRDCCRVLGLAAQRGREGLVQMTGLRAGPYRAANGGPKELE
jgi:hypothetical protein